MGESLYSLISTRVANRHTGVLKLCHENGQYGQIAFHNGRIKDIETDLLKGAEAARELAMWLHFSSESTSAFTPQEGMVAVDADSFVKLLAKAEKQAATLQKAVPMHGYSFKFSPEGLDDGKAFQPDELRVALALDGHRSVKAVIKETGMTDLRVLGYIYKLLNAGLLKKTSDAQPLSPQTSSELIKAFIEHLADYVGPAADLVVIDVLENLESTPEVVYRNELPQFCQLIADQLEGTDSTTFLQWAKSRFNTL